VLGDEMMNIGKNIEHIRKKVGYTRQYLAGNICDESTIYRIEKGLQIPRLDILQKLCHKLNVSIDYTLSLDNENTPYVYINKIEKLCREFLYQQEFLSIQYLIEEVEIYLKNNPNTYNNELHRFIDWQKAILTHKINEQPKLAEKLLRKLHHKKIINELDINIANSLALVLIEQDKYNDAYYLLRDGLQILNRLSFIEDKSLYPRISYNLAYIYYIWGDYDRGIDICYRLQYYLLSNHLLYSMGELYHMLGITYEKKEVLERSYHYFKKAAAVFFLEEKETYYIRTILALSEICFRMKKFEEGITTLEYIIDKINTLDDSDLVEKFKNKIEFIKGKYSPSFHN